MKSKYFKKSWEMKESGHTFKKKTNNFYPLCLSAQPQSTYLGIVYLQVSNEVFSGSDSIM